ncbi:APC5 protein [Coemansia aciculifera]|uniref:Anaphase-promoting complex subunit 5 n=1 Tax=Coemansia aciculifera TaxID=417176 RepID=A0A9W8IMD5_9FUNG|nr:APC5 protein [Coemansia aciculifera]KAJ2871034.1 APC5 protein [Coemansia aciculifera]
MVFSAYLSAPKLVLLAGVDLYSRRYDWGPLALSDIAQLLVRHVCLAGRVAEWSQLRRELDLVLVSSEGRTLRQLLGQRLKQLQSVDELHRFFDDVRQLVVEAEEARVRADGDSMLLDSESVFGIFVRRCCLAFDQLEFHQISGLFFEWQQAAEIIGGRGEAAEERLVQRSRVEAEEVVEQQIAQLEGGAVTKAARQDYISGHGRSHYLAYLSDVGSGESERASAELRRFFDSDSRSTHQNALLHLAGMRAQVGMSSGARLALAEATHVARDSQDHACLMYAQCWETRLLLDGRSALAAQQAASALVAKAAALGSRDMLAAGSIYAADALLLGGASPQRAFEAVVAARALVVELGVSRLSSDWWQCSARAWAQHGGVRVGELHNLLCVHYKTK